MRAIMIISRLTKISWVTFWVKFSLKGPVSAFVGGPEWLNGTTR